MGEMSSILHLSLQQPIQLNAEYLKSSLNYVQKSSGANFRIASLKSKLLWNKICSPQNYFSLYCCFSTIILIFEIVIFVTYF